jgi:parvulin-like peptidyl-prolyl isomerase
LAAQDDIFDIAKPSVRRSMALLAGGALIGLAIAGYGLFTAKGTHMRAVPPEAIAVVNQRPILRSDFMTQAQTQFAMPFAQTSREQRERVLEDMINEELMVQRGMEIDLPSFDPDVRNALVAGVELEVTADVLAQQATAEELRKYYELHQDKYSSEGVMQLRDLVVKKDESRSPEAALATATEAAKALRRGQSLEAVRKRYQLVDSGRFQDAGHVDVGDIFQFAVRAKVDDALFNAIIPLKDGEVSQPVAESDGVHLVLMVKHILPVPQTYEEAANRVWTDLKNESEAKVRAANLAYLRSRADIVVAPELAQ